MSGLKLKLTTKPSASAGSPPPATPLTTPGGSKPSLKFKISRPSTDSNLASPTTIAESATPATTKAGRATKPSAKLADSRKRIKIENETEDTISVQPAPKRIKLSLGSAPKTPKTPGVVLKAKIKGKPPKRPLGEGYDSEASDREIDPAIEEQFILRMIPGDDCDYLRQAISDKKIGIPISQGGADVQMKFFNGDGRRAAITVRKNIYAATLVDLPCIIEGMKSWDKRGWWKSADICQMLLVFAKVKKEEEAKTIALPSNVDPETYQYPHGLTAPMHYARKRRFRKRISRTAIEAVELAVERLLDADAEADDTRWEMIDPDRHGSQAFSPGGSSPAGYDYGGAYSGEEDAEGEEDDQGYFGQSHTNGIMEEDLGDHVDDLEADLEAAMVAEMEAEAALHAATPNSTTDVTPLMATGDTPAAQDDSGDESMEDEDDDEDGEGGDVDEEEQNRQNQVQGTREDIIELERQLAAQQTILSTQANPILRKRVEDSMRKIKNEIQLKKSSIGEGEEGGDE